MPDLPATLRQAAEEGGVGLVSACTAHPTVLDAVLRRARGFVRPLLVEATCNQVNQDGGYTGRTPADFARDVRARAHKAGLPDGALVLGGDHLGPNPWRKRPAEAAMAKAQRLAADFARAGFGKLHLDASMACADDPQPLPPERIAERAGSLAAAAEAAWRDAGIATPPVYVIGTEVPPPGGAHGDDAGLTPSDPAEVAHTVDLHRRSFAAAGIEDALERVVAVVVQPGVEFGDAEVHRFVPEAARPLTRALDAIRPLVFEAHSTDYQDEAALTALVDAKFAILKVGPELTFAYRQALYDLASIEAELRPQGERADPFAALERAMRADPTHWQGYLAGDAGAQRIARRFGLSDRCRYYWGVPEVAEAVAKLTASLGDGPLPAPLVRQAFPDLVEAGAVDPAAASPDALIAARIGRVIDRYARASRSLAPSRGAGPGERR